MSPPPGGLASRLLKPLIKHLTRQRRPLAPPAPPTPRRPTTPNQLLEEGKEFARDVWRSTFGGFEGGGGSRGGGRGVPAWETIPLRRQGGGGRTLPGGKSWPGGGQYRDLHTRPSPTYTPTSTSSTSRLAQSTRFLATRLRPHPHSYPRGPALVSHPGLHPSPARTFATYGSGQAGSGLVWNVPLGMRALADRLRKDEERVQKRERRRKVVGDGMKRGKVVRALKRFERSVGAGSGLDLLEAAEGRKEEENELSRAREYKRFFVQDQTVEEEVVQDAATTPVKAIEHEEEEQPARDPRKTTYLLLPLAPSLSHLLSLGTPLSSTNPHHYHPHQDQDEEIERSSYFHPYAPAPLLDNFPPTSLPHTHTHLMHLLQGLSDLVTLSTEEPAWFKTEETVDVELVLDDRGEPESMRLRFEGWSEVGVRGLVSRVLGEVEGEWYHVYEVVSSAPIRRSVILDEEQEQERSSRTTSLSRSTSSSLFSSTTSLSGISDPSALSGSSRAGSSYAPTIISDHEGDEDDQPTDLLIMEEQVAWRMPVLSEMGDVGQPATVAEVTDEDDLVLASSVGSWGDDEGMDLGWVEGRVWAD